MIHDTVVHDTVSTRVRRTDPETSRQVPDEPTIRAQQRLVLIELGRAQGTDQDVIESLWDRGVLISDSGARTRRCELCRLGLVEDSGERAKTASGRRSIVWRVTPAGWDLLSALDA